MGTKKAFNNLIELAALETEREGMKAANDYRIMNNLAQAYTEWSFKELADQVRKLKL